MWKSKAKQTRGFLRLLPPLLAVALCACAGPRVTIRNVSGCSALIPASWSEGVPSAPLPKGDTAGEAWAFADAQTGQLDKANGRTADTIDIVKRCETRDREAVQRLDRPWWKWWG